MSEVGTEVSDTSTMLKTVTSRSVNQLAMNVVMRG
jgi:hypothetical protein